ncbi:MAG: C40 family peptidase [Gemmatimonadales bacterium]
MRRRALGAWVAVASLALTSRLGAQQGFEGRVGRFYQDDGWTVYRLGVSRPLAGPIGTTFHGDYFRRVRGAEGALGGVGLDLTAFQGGGGGPYLVAGIGAGLGSAHSQSFSSTWSSWSAGLGYELMPASFLSVGAEGRWRHISLDRREGFEFAAGLSINLGGGRKAPAPTPAPGPAPRSNDDDLPTVTTSLPATPRVGHSAQLIDSVVATATDVMGRPYRYGGTGAGGGGFDCSGLIQYAYGQHGVTLPRTSAEQAREGKPVGKNPARLLPGDLLTFSNRGGPVTHVGLYIGNGRFIHSATRGVQVSVLSVDDPYGRWWWKRWVGVRRIVE